METEDRAFRRPDRDVVLGIGEDGVIRASPGATGQSWLSRALRNCRRLQAVRQTVAGRCGPGKRKPGRSVASITTRMPSAEHAPASPVALSVFLFLALLLPVSSLAVLLGKDIALGVVEPIAALRAPHAACQFLASMLLT